MVDDIDGQADVQEVTQAWGSPVRVLMEAMSLVWGIIRNGA